MTTMINTGSLAQQASGSVNPREIICGTCRLKFTDVPSFKLHRSTEFHVYNTKRQMAELEPITEEIFEQKKVLLQNSQMSVTIETRWKCYACAKIFKTPESLSEHERSKKHKKSAKEYLAKHPDESMSSIFKSIQTESSDFLSDINRSITGSNEPLTIEESSPTAPLPTKTTLESLRICLFCNEEFEGVKKNLDHMRLRHNFTILDIECLVNLKGMLAYIAERIQLGKMCLSCDRQFRTADRAQQHMRDMGHCMMPFDKDDEFELFYDFSRAYKELPQKAMITDGSEQVITAAEERKIAKNQRKAAQAGKAGTDEEQSSDDWEDVDVDDGDNIEEVEEVDSEEEASGQPSSQAEKSQDFVVVSEAGSVDPSSSFSLIDTTGKSSNVTGDNATESFHLIGDSASSIAEEVKGPQSTTTYSSAIEKVIRNKKGKTRAEAFANLDIKQAELLSTGEILLPNGKIIGHRDFKHIYRQRNKVPDQREAVVINKLALEYRREQHKKNGNTMPGAVARLGRPLDVYTEEEKKNGGQRKKYLLKADKDHMQIGWKNSKTMMKHFRLQMPM